MGGIERFAIVFICLVMIGEFGFSVEYSANIPVTTVVKKKPYDLVLSSNSTVIKMLPGAVDYRTFNVTAYSGNRETNVVFNFTGNFTGNLSSVFNMTSYYDVFTINETHFYTFYVNSFYVNTKNDTNSSNDEFFNLSLGSYTGQLNLTAIESGVSSYTNITLMVLNDSIGRVMVNATDNAGQPVEGAKVVIYYNLTVTERGFTNSKGLYFTNFYDYGSYLLLSVQKSGYLLKGYSLKVEQALHVITAELKGTAKLEWSPTSIILNLPVLKEASFKVSLFNTGTAKEQDIKINVSGGPIILTSSQTITEIIPGGSAEVTIYVPPQLLGFYSGTVIADGKWSIASFPVNVLVTKQQEKKSSGTILPLPPGNDTGPGGVRLPPENLSVSLNLDGTDYNFENNPPVNNNLSVNMVFKKGFSKKFFITVNNTGRNVLRDVRLTVESGSNLETSSSPVKYTELVIGESKSFLVEVKALDEVESAFFTIRITSGPLQIVKTLSYASVNYELTLDDLRGELAGYSSGLSGLRSQIAFFKSKGVDTLFFENYLSLIDERIVAASAAIDSGDFNLSTSWINEVKTSYLELSDLLSVISVSPDTSWLLAATVLLITVSLSLVVVIKKKNKLIDYYSIVKRRFFTWWILRKFA